MVTDFRLGPIVHNLEFEPERSHPLNKRRFKFNRKRGEYCGEQEDNRIWGLVVEYYSNKEDTRRWARRIERYWDNNPSTD